MAYLKEVGFAVFLSLPLALRSRLKLSATIVPAPYILASLRPCSPT